MRNLLVLLALTTFMVNCSEVGFSKVEQASTTQSTPDGDALGTVNGQGGTDTGGTGTGGTGTGGTGTGTGTGGTGTTPGLVVLPRILFIGPPCVRGSNCTVTFKLEAPQAATVEFDWATHDTLYQQVAPAGKIYAQPNVHYVPKTGHVIFQPGETQKTVYVQNINPYNYEVTIGVRMTACYLGQYNDLCSKFFR